MASTIKLLAILTCVLIVSCGQSKVDDGRICLFKHKSLVSESYADRNHKTEIYFDSITKECDTIQWVLFDSIPGGWQIDSSANGGKIDFDLEYTERMLIWDSTTRDWQVAHFTNQGLIERQ